MARRLALVVVALAAVAVFASGAFGFTGVTAERGVSVAVVDDENAFLGLQDDTVTCREIPGEGTQPEESCADTPLLEVTNQFASEMTVTDIRFDRGDVHVAETGLEPGDTLGVGHFGTLRADVSEACDPSGNSPDTVTLDVTISVETDGAEATRYDKEVSVTCERAANGGDDTDDGEAEPGEDVVVFDGCGSVDAGNYTVETYVYYLPGTGNTDGEFVERSGDPGGNAKLVGIVTSDNGTYVNTKFDFENKNCGGEKGTERLDDGETPPWESASETATETPTATPTATPTPTETED